MSKKISISLHNSHLFLKEEFTESTSNIRTISYASKNKVFAYMQSKALQEKIPLTKQEGLDLFTNRWLERSSNDQMSYNNNNNILSAQRREKENLPILAKRSFARIGVKLRFVKTCLPRQNKAVHRPEIKIKESAALYGFARKNLINSSIFICAPNKFLKNLNKRICSGVSREFVLVTLNLILLTVFSIVQRSNYGKGALFPKAFRTNYLSTICKSKIPNIISLSEENDCQLFTRGQSLPMLLKHRRRSIGLQSIALQRLYRSSAYKTSFCKTKPRYLYRYFSFYPYCDNKQSIFLKNKYQQTNCIFLFSNRSRVYVDFTNKKYSKPFSDAKATCSIKKATFMANGDLTGLSLPVQRNKNYLNGRTKFVAEATEKRPIQVSLRNTQSLSNDTKKWETGNPFLLSRTHYYKPCYLNNQRIFVENDTIPAKRGTIRHKIEFFDEAKLPEQSYRRKAVEAKLSEQSYYPEFHSDLADPCRSVQNSVLQGAVCKSGAFATKTKFCKDRPLSDIKTYDVLGKRIIFTAPELTLKRCFYKYGLLLLWPSTKSIKSSAFKKLDRDSFAKRSKMDNFLSNCTKPSFLPQIDSTIMDVQVAASFLPLSSLHQKRIEFLSYKSKVPIKNQVACTPKRSFVRIPAVRSLLSYALKSDPLDRHGRNVQNSVLQGSVRPILRIGKEQSSFSFAPSSVNKKQFSLFDKTKDLFLATHKQDNKNSFDEAKLRADVCKTKFYNNRQEYFICTSANHTYTSYFLLRIPAICTVNPKSSKISAEQSVGTNLGSVNETFSANHVSSLDHICNEQVEYPNEKAHRNTVLTSRFFSAEFEKYEKYWQKQNTFTKNSFWHFIQDSLVRNTSVSGYQFPELNKKEIIAFFVNKAVFNFSLNLAVLDNKNFLPLLSDFPQKVNKGFDSYLYLNHEKNSRHGVSKLPINLEENNKKSLFTDFSGANIQMQYAQVDLDEFEDIKYLFEKLGRNYEDYIRKPKDSLPALIISPSLEDDWEIEEEGIQIFRKRHFLQNQNTSATSNSAYSDYLPVPKNTIYENDKNEIFSERFKVNNASLENSSLLSSEIEERGVTTDFRRSKSEIQKHQNRVKNALRQAQEEIDTIAKKEEKASDKEKQGLSIPPLTRLEALYTIRNREKKVEQVKDFNSYKGQHSRNGNNLHRISDKFKNEVLLADPCKSSAFASNRQGSAKTKFLSETEKRIGKNRSSVNKDFIGLPIFDSLSLYSDAEKSDINFSKTNQLNFCYTPWLFSKYGDENICTDRKHSFFGEMSLRSTKINAQDQKQIFQQKTNYLFCSSKIKDTGYKLTDLSKINKKNSEPINFKIGDIGGSKNRIYFYNKLSQNKACQSSTPKTRNTPLLSPVSHRMWQAKRMEPSTFRVYPRNKSLPVIPTISKDDWKRMIEWQLKKYFLEEDKRLLPLSSYKQSYAKTKFLQESSLTKVTTTNNKQLKIKKVYFYLPWIYCYKPTGDLSQNKCVSVSYKNKNKAFVCESFVNNPLNFVKQNSLLVFSKQKQVLSTPFTKDNLIEWPLTRFDLMSFPDLSQFEQPRVLVNTLLNNNKNYFSTYNFNNYWQLPTQQNLLTLPVVVQKPSFYKASYISHFADYCKTWFYKPRCEASLRENDLPLTANKLSKNNNKKPTAKLYFDVVETKNRRQNEVKTQGDKWNNSINLYKPYLSSQASISMNRTFEFIVFEAVTKYSWLFIYTFLLACTFKQLFHFIYKLGLRDFFIKFLNSTFGRTITSEEFRYSMQNPPLTEFYMSNKRLEELLGYKSSKAQLLEIVWFLRNNCRGRNGPRGILLVGVPGIENVSVVQAIAGEANVPIIYQSLEKIASDTEPQRQLEQLYRRAHKQAPCVLFLDQLDTIGARRDQLFIDNYALNSEFIVSSTRKKESANKSVTLGNKLNVALRLLTILDGITKSTGVITVATAQDLTKLDPALLRPKRFDKRIYLSLPNQDDRIQLFKKQIQNIGYIKEIPWNYLSLRAENMSMIDIRSAINYSLFRAVLKNSAHTVETLEYGIDCVKSLTEPLITKNISSNTFKNRKICYKRYNITKLYKSFR